jgi:Plant transposase (Ptta/En/Spm family)
VWWRDTFDTNTIRRAFYISMRDSYKARIAKWKRAFREEKKIPSCVGVENWNAWNAHYESPEQKAKSDKARANRMSEPGGLGTGMVKHRGGSRPANRLADEMVS